MNKLVSRTIQIKQGKYNNIRLSLARLMFVILKRFQINFREISWLFRVNHQLHHQRFVPKPFDGEASEEANELEVSDDTMIVLKCVNSTGKHLQNQ